MVTQVSVTNWLDHVFVLTALNVGGREFCQFLLTDHCSIFFFFFLRDAMEVE
jgi:hypothetical protein